MKNRNIRWRHCDIAPRERIKFWTSDAIHKALQRTLCKGCLGVGDTINFIYSCTDRQVVDRSSLSLNKGLFIATYLR